MTFNLADDGEGMDGGAAVFTRVLPISTMGWAGGGQVVFLRAGVFLGHG